MKFWTQTAPQVPALSAEDRQAITRELLKSIMPVIREASQHLLAGIVQEDIERMIEQAAYKKLTEPKKWTTYT